MRTPTLMVRPAWKTARRKAGRLPTVTWPLASSKPWLKSVMQMPISTIGVLVAVGTVVLVAVGTVVDVGTVVSVAVGTDVLVVVGSVVTVGTVVSVAVATLVLVGATVAVGTSPAHAPLKMAMAASRVM